ncbi:hypothetical protein BHAP_0331 [Bifidobacterium hapali]|uniref:Uncharacterized protein n=2 Tax=Bifidobacterium hapali TaxID=1630172 RepID=A0A261G4Y2_9BIFI|nr:hypothetical protein BHAP_0331 [Bifidobacterium hapali]
MKVLQAKGIAVAGMQKNEKRNGNDRHNERTTGAYSISKIPMYRAQPFKATGHKGGISRQGN